MDQNTMIVIILAFTLVVGVIFVPPMVADLWSEIRELTKDFRNFWLSDWGDTGDNATNGANGGASIGLTIYYKDGTTTDFRADEFSILPLSISDNGGQISKINVQLWCEISYEGQISSWVSDLRLDVDIYQYTSTKIADVKLIEDTKTGSSWQNNEEKCLGDWDITATEIDSKLSEDGDFSLRIIGKIKLDVAFTDGNTDQMLGENTATWYFQRLGAMALSSLTVYIVYTPLH